MITRNLHNYFIDKITGGSAVFINRSGNEQKISGSDQPYYYYNAIVSTSLGARADNRRVRTLRIGIGTTEPSYDDYELDQFLNVEPKTITRTQAGAYRNIYEIVSATFLNETDSDWIVTEVGEYLAMSDSDHSVAILLAREVFDPVTVKPGQTFSVSMKLF